MKTRVTNVLIATIQLLITAVWVPTVWTLAELPWTLNEEREASALLRYVDDDLGIVSYEFKRTYYAEYWKCGAEDWLCSALEEMKEREGRVFTISTGPSFIPFAVFTLICIAVQYLLIGKVSLRFIKGKNDEDP